MMRKVVIAVLTISLCVLFIVSLEAKGNDLPQRVVLDSISEHYGPVSFDHETHLMIAGGPENCAECHHQHPDIREQSCKDCHSINEGEYKRSVVHSFLACRNCHGTYDISDPAMPDLKVAYHQTCFKCHKGIGNIAIDPAGCTETCHAGKSEETSMKPSPARSEKGIQLKGEKGGIYGEKTKIL